jgi:hypothetical protein
MRRYRRLLLFVLVAIAGAFVWLRLATHNTPAGQPPLVHLDSASLATLKADFNRAAAGTRMIVLLAPT